MAEIIPFRGVLYDPARAGPVDRLIAPPYDVISPAERTLSGPRLDRLKLKRATRTHLSQVLAVYADRTGAVEAAFAGTDAAQPALEARMDGVVHRIFRLTDATAQARIAAAMADKRVYIADGHHRYETMLALREE